MGRRHADHRHHSQRPGAQLADLRALRLPELQARFAELVGEETRCLNKGSLLRRIGEALEARAAQALFAEDASTEVTSPTEEGGGAEPDSERLQDLTVEQLRTRYLAVVGRSTRSHDKRYLIWKIRQAQQGKVLVGPVGRRQPGETPVEHKVLPLRMPAETILALDEVWRRRGLNSRMDLVAFEVTEGQCHDCPKIPRPHTTQSCRIRSHGRTVPRLRPGAWAHIERLKPRYLLADKTYDTNNIRFGLAAMSAQVCIPAKSNRHGTLSITGTSTSVCAYR